jgi:hypothetical protein
MDRGLPLRLIQRLSVECDARPPANECSCNANPPVYSARAMAGDRYAKGPLNSIGRLTVKGKITLSSTKPAGSLTLSGKQGKLHAAAIGDWSPSATNDGLDESTGLTYQPPGTPAQVTLAFQVSPQVGLSLAAAATPAAAAKPATTT